VNVRNGVIAQDVGLKQGGDSFGEGSTLFDLHVTSRGSVAWTTSIVWSRDGVARRAPLT
jgi:hypothetical protein